MILSNQAHLEVVDEKNLSFGVELLDHEAEAVNGGFTLSAKKLDLSLKNLVLSLSGENNVFVGELSFSAEDLLVTD